MMRGPHVLTSISCSLPGSDAMSLAAQLKLLSGTVAGGVSDTRTRIPKATFLFEPHVAADTDTTTIYHLVPSGAFLLASANHVGRRCAHPSDLACCVPPSICRH
jgi:hypothetical protein